jgi:hypothetical protein
VKGASASAFARPALRAGFLSWAVVIAAILAIALAERVWLDLHADVSWLITLGEKVLAGNRPYIDFIEVNPPASIFIYLPAVMFARLTGLAPEFAVGLFVFIGAGASLWASARILITAKILRHEHLWPLAAIFALVLTVLPGATFAQREHIALIAFLPALAVMAARAEGKSVALHWAVTAGIGAGIAAIIKPHFALPLMCCAATAAFCARSWRPVFAPENCIAAGLLAIYAAVVIYAYPEFISGLMPVIMATYVSRKLPLWELLAFGTVPFWSAVFLAIVAIKRKAAFEPPFVLLLAASAGFLLAFAVQQKGVAYQAYPALALIFAAAAIASQGAFAMTGKDRAVGIGAIAVICGIVCVTFSWFAAEANLHSLIGPIRASVSHPKVLNISGGGTTGMGFPLTRQVGGTWVGRTCGQWISVGALTAKNKGVDRETAAVLDRYIALDRAWLREDIANNKPDIILADRIRFDWLKWAEADPALADELKHYRELASDQGIHVLRRTAD